MSEQSTQTVGDRRGGRVTDTLTAYALALAALVAAVLLRYLLDPWMGDALPLVTLFMAVTIGFGFLYTMLQFAGHQFLATRMYAERKEGPLWLGPKLQAGAEARGRRLGRPVVAGDRVHNQRRIPHRFC